jgi:hypothetical protein
MFAQHSGPNIIGRSLLVTALAAAAVGTASAQFSIDAAVNYVVGTQPSGVAAADYNGDQITDLATTVDGPDRIQILLGDGTGQFNLGPSSVLPNSSSPQDLVAGDFDSDQDIDLAVAVRDPQGSVVIMINGGAGTFTIGGTFVVGERPRGLAVADMDGDNDLDLAVANRDSDSASVLTNNGSGVFSVATFAAGGEPRTTVFGDFDGDTDLDLAVTNHDDRTVGLYTNTGGVFTAAGTLSVGGVVRPDGITAADLDNDMDADLAVATSDQTLNINQATIFINTGGAFSGPFNYPTGGMNTSGIAAADFDCDGLIDLATSNQDSSNISLLRNTGGGAFGAPMLVAVGSNPEELTWGDFDGDEDADLAVANRNSNDVSVLVNQTCEIEVIPGDVNGDGFVNTTDLLELLASWGTCGGCPADLNGDGFVNTADLLILLANWTG